MKSGIATAQRGWAERAEVTYTYPLDKLRSLLADGKRASGVTV